MHVVVDGIIYEQQRHGGISRIFREVLPRLCNIDDTVTVTLLTSKEESSRPNELPAHAHIHHQALLPPAWLIRKRKLWWLTPHVRALAQQHYLKRDRIGIWHSTYYTLLEPWDGPVVVTVADMIYERFRLLFTGPMNDQIRRQKQQSIHRADRIICISDVTKKEVLQFYNINPEKITVIPPAYNRDVFRIQLDPVKVDPFAGRPFLLYVGGRTHYKNFAGLVRAYHIWQRRQDIPLVVVGSPWLKEEKQLLADLKIEGSVHLLTAVDDRHLASLYNQAAAFVYPSLYEGFGIPLLEAMACGCPVVASRIPSTVEVAGEHPIYFDPADQGDCLAALETALSEGRHSERTRAGLGLVDNFAWDTTARQTLAVYRTLDGTI
jgi:glycosyltransferase involved in cell wall biosynthesis